LKILKISSPANDNSTTEISQQKILKEDVEIQFKIKF
ncbi:MAG: hypothetical protein Athens101428_666, partial [Candidatus Berkelbacteria bacterium Athens1014_28]